MRAISSTSRVFERVYEFLILNSQFSIVTALLAASPVGVAPATQGSTSNELKTKFEQRLSDLSSKVDGVVGYEIVDLSSGDRFAHLERETFPTASTIKLTLVYELFKQAEEGRIRLDDTLALDRAKAVGGTGVLVEMGTPVLSIRDYAVLM